MWKIYPVKPHGKKFSSISKYRTRKNLKLENDLDYKANLKEIQNYIKKGWLHMQPKGPKTSFISKLFYNSVQNDNLPQGSIYETFNKISVPEAYHLTSNSFSNSWIIDVKYLKNTFRDKIVNLPNGAGQIGFIIEFTHKKLFLKSLAISVLFILVVVFINIFKAKNSDSSLNKQGIKHPPL